MTDIEKRLKRIIGTPLGSRVMLPNFGSKLYELIDKEMNDEWRLKFIAYGFKAFWDTSKKRLWDAQIEPKKIVFKEIGDSVKVEIELTTTKVVSWSL
jgi:phage baseplate assembly protein W